MRTALVCLAAFACTGLGACTSLLGNFTIESEAGATNVDSGEAPKGDDAASPLDVASAVDTGMGPADAGIDAPIGDGGADAGCVAIEPSPAAKLPLDAVRGATAAYGLRKLRASYTGALVTVVRTSDGVTLDVPANAAGNFPVCDVMLFAKGSVLAVSIWHDQSGNGYDIQQPQTTAAFSSQSPTLGLNAYQNLPGVHFSYAAETYLTASFPWIAGAGQWSSAATLLGDVKSEGSYQPIFAYGDVSLGDTHSIFALDQIGGQFDFGFGVYGTNVPSTIATTAPSTFAISSTGTTTTGYVNGASFTGNYGTQNISSTTFVMGGSPVQSGIWLNGYVGTLLLYPSALTEADITTLQAADRAYYKF